MKFIGGVLILCRDAVGELYCPSWLGYHEIHWGILTHCGEAVGNYSAPADRDTMKYIGGVIILCRDAVGVLYCPSWVGYHEIHWRSLNPLQRCSRWIILPQLTGIPWNSLEESQPSEETQSVYSTALADWDAIKFIGGFLSIYRDAVGVFYCPSWLGYREIHWGSLNPLQRGSRWIIVPQLTGIPWNTLGES